MKKLFILLITFILILTLIGCNVSTDPTIPEDENQEDNDGDVEDQNQDNDSDNSQEDNTKEENNEIEMDEYYNMGKILYELGLFSGVSTTEYVPNLEGSMNRQEAMKMIVSALGWEPSREEDCPFVDVADWAKPYVGRAYMEKIALGTVPEQNIFGGEDPVTQKQLLTFYLRALGYESTYAYDNAEKLGESTGISKNLSGSNENLKRYDLVAVTYNTLKANKKNKALTVVEELVYSDIVDEDKVKEYDLIKEYKYQEQRKDGPYEGNKEILSQYIKEDDKVLVMFYLPNGNESIKMMEAFENAGIMLADVARVVKVNGRENKDLIEEYNITIYPTIKLFKKDESKEITLPAIPDEETIVKWVKNS